MMPVQTSETQGSVVAFAPKKSQQGSTMMTDDAGQQVIALVQKASEMAKADCQRAIDLADRVSSELRAAEERARAFEQEANYFRDRAARAEEWLSPALKARSSRRSFTTKTALFSSRALAFNLLQPATGKGGLPACWVQWMQRQLPPPTADMALAAASAATVDWQGRETNGRGPAALEIIRSSR